MKYFRQKRIDLTDIDARWNGCYLMIGTKGFMEVQALQREISKIQNKLELNEIKQRKARRKLEDVSLEDEAIADLGALQNENIDLSSELIRLFVNITKENFISGLVYDNDMEATRPATAEDIEGFDNETLTRTVGAVLGNVEKKV